MNYERIATAIIEDLAGVARSGPNERLPKEEQVRSRIFCELLSVSETVCVERGYASIDDRSSVEVDIWSKDSTGNICWLELKRCWQVQGRGWVNKTSEQHKNWTQDVKKLAAAPTEDTRIFVLVGFFDLYPFSSVKKEPPDVVGMIGSFFAHQLRHCVVAPFSWRGTTISHIGVWVWEWRAHETITI